MILVDANLLLYAEDSRSDAHEAARTWWDAQLSGSEPVGLCWPVLTAFIRICCGVPEIACQTMQPFSAHSVILPSHSIFLPMIRPKWCAEVPTPVFFSDV